MAHMAYIQTRNVRSAQPVAIHVPNGFHAIERMLDMRLAGEPIELYIHISHVQAAAAAR